MDYLAVVEPAKRALIEHYYDFVRDLFPEAAPGTKYAMAVERPLPDDAFSELVRLRAAQIA